jgi:hypothetical protein
MRTDDQRASQLLAPLCEIPEGRKHMRELRRCIGGNASSLLAAIARAEAMLAMHRDARERQRPS